MSVLSLLEFVAKLEMIEHTIGEVDRSIIESGCKAIQHEAKSAIGTYRYGWPQLAPATQADRERKGYAANEPLLRTGELRDSIEYTVISDREGAVGSDLDIAVYQELGTTKIPPRPFLRSAAVRLAPEIARAAGRATAALLAGENFEEIEHILHLMHRAYENFKEAGEELLEDDEQEQRR